MEMPISRAAAYLKRNRTTHSWAGDSNLMSRSCPNTQTLHDHMLQTRAAGVDTSNNRRSTNVVYRSPPSSCSSSPGRSTSSEKSSRGDKKSLERPSSSYSYDGGFFISANNASKDFFVIDPEWVSEDQTVKKLDPNGDGGSGGRSVGGGGGGGGGGGTSTTNSSWRRSFMWNSYRRSKSAPPPKYRNPITWKY